MSRPPCVVELNDITAAPPDEYSFTFPESGLVSTALDAVVRVHRDDREPMFPVEPCIPLGPVDIVISPYLSVVLQGQQGLRCVECVGCIAGDVGYSNIADVELGGTSGHRCGTSQNYAAHVP